MPNSRSHSKVLVATTCVGTYEKYLSGLLNCFENLRGKNLSLFISHPPILESGKKTNNEGRLLSIKNALESKAEWIFFVDVDIRPDEDTVEKFLANGYPFMGGAISARDDPNFCIGHIYSNRNSRSKTSLTKDLLTEPMEVDGVGGGFMMVHKKIFEKLDLSKYKGSQAYEHGYMGADEFFDNQVYKKTGVRPMIIPDLTAWHLYGNQKSRLWGRQEFSDKEIV